MGRPRKTHVSAGKAKIIEQLMDEYDIETPQDIQAALRDLLGPTIQNILESEIENQMEQAQEEPAYTNSRNGYKPKTLKSNYGEIPIKVPQDRNSDFDPRVVPKHKRDISEIEDKIISMYAKGMSTRQISDQVQDIYGFDVSESLVSGITNKLMPEIEEWQKRPLSAIYPIVFIDAIVFNVRDNGVIKKQAAYIILGISEEGRKEVLTITIGETESAKYWLSILNEPRCSGYFGVMCRWSIRHLRSRRSRVSADRVPAMHRSCCSKYAQIRVVQGQESVRYRPENNISRQR